MTTAVTTGAMTAATTVMTRRGIMIAATGTTTTTGAGGGNYVAGETVAINAVPYPVNVAFSKAARSAIYYDLNPATHPQLPANDLVFQNWVINSGKPVIADTNAAITALTMPAGPVNLTATFTQRK